MKIKEKQIHGQNKRNNKSKNQIENRKSKEKTNGFGGIKKCKPLAMLN